MVAVGPVLEPGARVDRYIVEDLLGEGGMAAVYRVRHAELGTLHALKILTLAVPSLHARIRDEGRHQATLLHPNVLPVTDVFDVNGAPALLLEFVPGPTLHAWIQQHDGPPPLAEVARLFAGILDGVAFIHRSGLVHRDLKPANVLLQPSPGGLVPRVADFGLAKVLDTRGPTGRTQYGARMGSPAYMAPEQARDARSVDARADVFALGCILYEMLTGQLAFPQDDGGLADAIEAGTWVRVERFRTDVPARVLAAIDGCLQPNPDGRIPSCEALAALLAGSAPPTTVRPAPKRTYVDPDAGAPAAGAGPASVPPEPSPSPEPARGRASVAPAPHRSDPASSARPPRSRAGAIGGALLLAMLATAALAWRAWVGAASPVELAAANAAMGAPVPSSPSAVPMAAPAAPAAPAASPPPAPAAVTGGATTAPASPASPSSAPPASPASAAPAAPPTAKPRRTPVAAPRPPAKPTSPPPAEPAPEAPLTAPSAIATMVASTFARGAADVASCAGRRPAGSPGETWTITVTIAATGAVRSAVAASEGPGDDALRACLVAAATRWRFAPIAFPRAESHAFRLDAAP